MLKFSDDQLDIIQRAAAPLHQDERAAFLTTVAELLRGQEIGDGSVARAAAEAQRKFLRPVDLARRNGQGKIERGLKQKKPYDFCPAAVMRLPEGRLLRRSAINFHLA
jgi:hypothetical protein